MSHHGSRSATPEKLSNSKRCRLRRDALQCYQASKTILSLVRPIEVAPITCDDFLRSCDLRLKSVDELSLTKAPPTHYSGAVACQDSKQVEQWLLLPPTIPSGIFGYTTHSVDASRCRESAEYERKAMEAEDMRGKILHIVSRLCAESGEPVPNRPFIWNTGAA